MNTKRTWKPGLHNLTAVTLRSEIKRLEGEVRHPDGDPEVVELQIVKLSGYRDELARRMLSR
jgi:hypothetical protein